MDTSTDLSTSELVLVKKTKEIMKTHSLSFPKALQKACLQCPQEARQHLELIDDPSAILAALAEERSTKDGIPYHTALERVSDENPKLVRAYFNQ